MQELKLVVGWEVGTVPPGLPPDPGYGQGRPLPPHLGGGPVVPPNYPSGGPVYPGGPTDPGFGRPGWSPTDPGYDQGHLLPPHLGGGPVIPPGGTLPPDVMWPIPPGIDNDLPPKPGDPPRPPVTVPPGKVAIAIWVSGGYGWKFMICDKPPEKPTEPQPKGGAATTK